MRLTRPRRAGPALLLAVSTLLAACQNLAPVVRPEGASHSGRLAVQVDGDAARSFSASFELHGRPEAGWMALANPLGAQIGVAEWSPAQAVRLRTPDETRRYASLEDMAEELTGQSLPIAALFDWLEGRPWPARTHQAGGADGFEQLGWDVRTDRIADGLLVAVRAQPLPRVTVRAKLDGR
ncbi:lipoprotein insertase outer membrane protein LolB [Sphaerotilus mobilis]|uniref:Outer-membrane lipoprotein LolB n=1 Tax=Sphaerotilus mobilis TaxID=47994 RepID=A0A4Q7LGE4_9BURK|nr:lipoprotein insertase outer membrane protein LolB [Sphaerotilus mobilis]RZS53162.1 outer membrane lipoprotein LolB [Sphaerotilus mobilis]